MPPREIVCTVDAPRPVTESPHLAAGCLVQDITLTSPETIHEIRFRNFYIHSVSVWMQRATSDDGPATSSATATSAAAAARVERAARVGSWELSVCDRVLMPNPLYDSGSQDYITISRKQSATDWRGVTRLRFVLRQPAPHWRQFRLEEVRLLAPPAAGAGAGAAADQQEEGEGAADEWRQLVEATHKAVHAENGVQVFAGPDGEIVYIGGSYDVQTLILPEG